MKRFDLSESYCMSYDVLGPPCSMLYLRLYCTIRIFVIVQTNCVSLGLSTRSLVVVRDRPWKVSS